MSRGPRPSTRAGALRAGEFARPRHDRGSAVPFAVACLGLVLLLGAALGVAAAMVADHRAAQSAADLAALAQAYPYLVVDMQAYLFPGVLTERYDRATPVFAAPHGNAAWYLADLLEHYGVAWGQWDWLLTLRNQHADSATSLRVFDTACFKDGTC